MGQWKLASDIYCTRAVKPKVYEDKIANEPITKSNTIMKTKNQIETTAISTLGRSGTARAAVAFLASATTVLPMLAADGPQTANADDRNAVRPFLVNIPENALVGLQQRIMATRWPDKETVADDSQGVQLATMQKLARYWASDYDWRKCEAKLNALPMFVTTIDGLDIQFIWVRSKNPNALPMIVTHGWPGSIIEQLKIIDPLTNPK